MPLTLRFLLTWALAMPLAQAATVSVQLSDNTGKPLPDGVVYLESTQGAKQSPKPLIGAEIEQTGKQFVPRVLVVTVGTAVTFPNHDTVRHHVYSFSPAKTFELKLYTGRAANPVVFDKAGVAVLGCNIHDNMSAWVVVVDTPYFARGDRRGVATLRDIPAGNYRLRMWHPGLPIGTPAAEQAINVTSADLSISHLLPGSSP